MLRRFLTPLGLRLLALTLSGIAVALANFAPVEARPQALPVSAFAGGLHWRCIGPFRGGRSVAVSGVPGDPQRFYFGAVGGGVWRTDNAGRTWRPIFDAQPVASIGALAVAPSDPNVIYAGSGEADFRSDLQQGDGMYKSLDAGSTWQHIGLSDTRAIGRISVDPHDARDVVVAALGHPYGPNRERGIFRSSDGGKTWRNTLFVNADTGAITVARDPQRSNILFAALLQTRRPPWNVYPPSKGPGSGLYRSSDGGDSWAPVHGGFPTAELGRIGVAVAPTDSNRVYAIVDAKAGGLYRSDDAGQTWKLVDPERRIWQRGWYFEEVSVDPRNRDMVYVSNTALYRSSDAGATFTAIKGAPGGDDYHMLWIDPSEPARMILASDQGTIVSVDGAQSWSSWYNQPTAQIYHVSTDTQFPFWVYGAQQDSGAIGLPSRSTHRGISRADWLPLEVGGESDNIAPDPLHPGIVFGSRVVREDIATRVARNVSPTLAHPGNWRATWTLPLAFSPADPTALYFSRQVLFATVDGGAQWNIISPDLTRENPGIPANLDAPAAADIVPGPDPRRGVIYAIAPSPLQKDTLWIGTDDGNIGLTRDAGKHWADVTPPGLSAWSKVGIIEASHFDAGTAYAAIDRHRLDDDRPYMYRTRDGGRTWRNVVAGIPAGSFVNAVREDPVRRGLLYAGTETGVFVSLDDGDSWQSLQFNLPPASVRDLAVRADALVIATHGRSFWILDDVTPLREDDARIHAARAWLFTPQVAYRMRRADDDGTPLPPDTPAGENPPDGAIIDYRLRTGARTASLEITDARGGLVRRWSSTDQIEPIDPRKLEFPASWVSPPQRISTAPGMHRFVWDLHYATDVPPAGEQIGDPFAVLGIWAVPGTYHVRLTADGQVLDRTFVVKLDPREPAGAADLAAQFAFAREIEGLRAEIQLSIRRAAGGASHQQQLADIDSALAELEAAVESAPHAPTSDERLALELQRAALRDAGGSAGNSQPR
jgi:photosystem II stability/assembly factor-like uncharacterized protein